MTSITTQNFLTLGDLSPNGIQNLLQRAIELKRLLRQGERKESLRGKMLAMIFECASTRTRLSFASGMAQLGGQSMELGHENSQLARGESIEDTMRVLSQMADGVMARTQSHETLLEMAKYSSIPVINGLSDLCHPCQILADLQTWQEHRGDFQGKTAAWLGDGNNVCHSWIDAARLCDFQLRIASPAGYTPDANLLAAAQGYAVYTNDPKQAADGADLLITDVWTSMGQEGQRQERLQALEPYQVNAGLLSLAKDDALFMHCLPAHRGEEVTAEVIDGPHSVVWDEAGNRLHAQKALLELLLEN
ncbi:MAG: ornithine carbamoyltransferase [Candidatus Eutrophobiaceae bacterium]